MIEIERKFLVTVFPEIETRPFSIRQGYLTVETDSVELRIRQRDSSCFLTLKSEGGLSREEYEFQIDASHFAALWPKTAGRQLEKTRHVGNLPDGHRFELDVFSGRLAPLMLVEVEFASEGDANAFVPPSWFGDEVTYDKRYRNRTLVRAIP